MTTKWQEHFSDSRAGADRFIGPTESTPHAPTHRQQGSTGSRHSKGIQNPTKKTSDDIRQQSIVMEARHLLPHSYQTQGIPTMAIPSQPPLVQRHGKFPPVPDQTSSAGFRASFGSEAHRWSSIDIPIRETPLTLVSYYPRPEFRRAHSEIGEVRRQFTMNMGNPVQPRILSNPFPPTILEDLEGERDSGHQISGSFLPAEPSLRSSEHSAINPQMSLMSSHLALVPVLRMKPGEINQSSQQSRALLQKENDSFSIQLGRRQNVSRNQTRSLQGGRWNWDQDQIRNNHNRRQSFHQEQLPMRRLPQPPDKCVLFVSGLPDHLDAKALWHMLSPIQGLKWIAPLKKAQNEEGYIFTNLV